MTTPRPVESDSSDHDDAPARAGTPDADVLHVPTGKGSPLSLQERRDLLSAAMLRFGMRDDGWLRLVPDSAACIVHIKWKFTSGDFKGRYCYVRGYVSELASLLDLLWFKVERSYEGTFKPTVDTFYRGE